MGIHDHAKVHNSRKAQMQLYEFVQLGYELGKQNVSHLEQGKSTSSLANYFSGLKQIVAIFFWHCTMTLICEK